MSAETRLGFRGSGIKAVMSCHYLEILVRDKICAFVVRVINTIYDHNLCYPRLMLSRAFNHHASPPSLLMLLEGMSLCAICFVLLRLFFAEL